MIENTSQRDPSLHFLGSLADGTDRYITDMESAGQSQLVASEQMPSQGPWPELEAVGIIKGEPVEGDPLFVYATLPDGWRKEATDHPMHSRIVDERGVGRVSIFYKAAFYDRRADCYLTRPGLEASIAAVWGTEPPSLPQHWDVFTDAEKGDYIRSLAKELHDNEKNQHLYHGDGLAEHKAHAARIRAFQALVPETQTVHDAPAEPQS